MFKKIFFLALAATLTTQPMDFMRFTVEHPPTKPSVFLFYALGNLNQNDVIKALDKGVDANTNSDEGYSPFGWMLAQKKSRKQQQAIALTKILLKCPTFEINQRLHKNDEKTVLFELIDNPCENYFAILNLVLRQPELDFGTKYQGLNILEYSIEVQKRWQHNDPLKQLPWAKKNHDLLVQRSLVAFED